MIEKDEEGNGIGYIKGLYIYDPRYHNKKVPSYILANGSIDVNEFLEYISDENNVVNGRIFFDIMKGEDSGKIYQRINKWRMENGWKPSNHSEKGLNKKKVEELTDKYKLPT